MKLFVVILLFLWPILGATASDRNGVRGLKRHERSDHEFRIINLNLYLGTDFTVFFDPSNFAKSIYEVVQGVFDLVKSTDYPSRAKVLARSIIERDADVVCLQEVFTYSFASDSNGSDSTPVLDFLAILLDELNNMYELASAVDTPKFAIPYSAEDEEAGMGVTYLLIQDSDVILTRRQENADGSAIIVVDASHELFTTQLVFPIGSATPGVPALLDVKRGFCWIEMMVVKSNGQQSPSIIVSNTHFDGSAFVSQQKQQSIELVTAMAQLTGKNGVLHSIIVGDLNARAPNPPVANCSSAPLAELDVYTTLACRRFDPFAGKNEFTWGTEMDLLTLLPDETLARIDHILVSENLQAVANDLFGTEPLAELNGMYPSDHFGMDCVVTVPATDNSLETSSSSSSSSSKKGSKKQKKGGKQSSKSS